MTKIVINSKAGGFGLSTEAMYFYGNLKKLNFSAYISDPDEYGSYVLYKKEIHKKTDGFNIILFCVIEENEEFPEKIKEAFVRKNLFSDNDYLNIKTFRTDCLLIETVETLQELSFGDHARLKVIEIPDDVEWEINEYNGAEVIREVSRVWS